MGELFTKRLLIMLLLTAGSIVTVRAQVATVSGTILDETGEPLPGASVAIKGTTSGTISDVNGNYSINVEEDDVLVISFVGYAKQEITVSGQTTVNITLQPDIGELQEIVVVGFGSQKKGNVSGAVTTIDMEEALGDRPVTNVNEALQGLAPGLQVVTASGQPGNTQTSLELRGLGSINGSTPPLVLVDNVEMSLQDINPNDIKTVTVLKDAAASSIYGARAAWGVILITTKKPEREQGVKFNYKATMSFSSPLELPEKTSVKEFVTMLDEIGIPSYWSNQNVKTWLDFIEAYEENPGDFPESGIIEGEDGFNYSVKETYPIRQLLDNQGTLMLHDLSLSGGSEKSSFRISLGYLDQDGIIVTDNDAFERFNVNAFLDTDISSKIKSSTNIFYRRSKRTNPIGQYNQAVNNNVWLPTGEFTLEDGRVLPFDSPDNLERLLPHPVVNVDVARFFQRLTYEPIENLKLTGELTFERGNTTRNSANIQLETVNRSQFVPNNSNPEFTRTSNSFNESENLALNMYGNYSITVADKHNFGVMIGYNQERSENLGFNVARANLLSTDVRSIRAAIGITEGDETIGESAVLGYFGRLQYNYNERYFIEGNIRYDGSSRFPRNDRFGTFTSVSAAWNMTNEAFLENSTIFSLLKLRGSYGAIGNQAVENELPYISQWDPIETWWLNAEGVRQTTIPPGLLVSPSLTWETAQKLNIAVDAEFLKGRLATTFEVYRNRTIDMLRPGLVLPAILGTEAPVNNAADLETKGWEVDVAWRDQVGSVRYGLSFNVYDNKTEITRFDNPAGLISDFYVGQEVGEIWGYVTDGYYTVDDFVEGTLDAHLNGDDRRLKDGVVVFEDGQVPYPGDIKYVDLDGDGVITDGDNTLGNPGDRKVIGNNRRRYLFGINGYVSYKGFDLSFALSGVGKRDRDLTGPKDFPYQGQFDNMFKHQLDYWTPDNQDAFYPRMYGNNRNFSGDRGNYGRSRRVQSKYLYDASYLRINNITLAYTLPSSIVNKISLDRVRVFVSAENLHTFKDLPKGIQPDQNVDGIYPVMKTFAFGAQLSF